MVSTVKDNNDRVIAFLEWRQVGQSGFDKLHGEYIWINHLWVHDDYKGYAIIKELIDDVLLKARMAKYAYFTRRKYQGRMSKLYKREDFSRLLRKDSPWAAILT